MKFKICSILISIIVAFFLKELCLNEYSSHQENLNGKKLAFELCEIYGADQSIRLSKGFKDKWELAILPVDTINFEKFLRIVKQYGYPREEVLGKENFQFECVKSASTAIMLHNPHRLINEPEVFKLFLDEVNKGHLSRSFLADILDKYYWVRRDSSGNRMLLYGSQFGKPCIKYRYKSDSVRNAIGLPPLKDSDFMICD